MSKESEIRMPTGVAAGQPRVLEAAQVVRSGLGDVPKSAAVLGSGFAPVVDACEIVGEVPFSDVPDMVAPGVPGHAGRFISARINGLPLLLQIGRLHFYEGHSMHRTTFSIRVLAALGIDTLLLTNAAGGINRDFTVGDFMLIRDHINLMGTNPLIGAKGPAEQRFVNMVDAYDHDLRRQLKTEAAAEDIRLQEGVYLAVSGPSYETPAEIEVFRKLGADAVGMSTVPETIVARSLGLRIIGLSCITNLAAGMTPQGPSHGEVLETGRETAAKAARLLSAAARIAVPSRPVHR